MARYGREWRSEAGTWRRQRPRRWAPRRHAGEGPARPPSESRPTRHPTGYGRDVYGLGFEPGYAPGYGYEHHAYGRDFGGRRSGGRRRADVSGAEYDAYDYDDYADEYEAYTPEEYEGAARVHDEEFEYGFPYGPEYGSAGERRPWYVGGYGRQPGRGRGESPRARRFDDRHIRDNVYESLFQDTWIDPRRLHVEVRDGVVTLSGEVADFMEARYVWDDAWETPGVRGVINNLTVRADLPREASPMPQTRHRFPMAGS